MNILFVMKHRANAGNIHAVADYMRIGKKFGHNIALFGTRQPWLPDVNFSTDVKAFDKVVYLFESEIYRVKRLQEVALMGYRPREDRLILDMDGMYNPVVTVDNYDSNHKSQAERDEWIAYLDTLSDRVMKPVLALPKSDRSGALTFYGFDPALVIDQADAPEKQYDILHVGHNWWRWKEIAGQVLPSFEEIRPRIGRIGFIGLWWDAPPAEGPDAGPMLAFESDPERLRRLNIETRDSVMYNEVIATMSTARINIFTQRPVLHHLRHLTLKYFEIFYADTIPLLMLDADHAEAVYGHAGRELSIQGRVAERISDALARPDHYKGLVADVRRHLAAHHGYDRRVEELISALQN